MARPIKQGIDYFPVDCSFDDKTEMFLIETGATGLGIMVTLWQMIYSNEGYFINADEDLVLLVKKRVDVDIQTINGCINVALKRCLFDKSKHERYAILTSKAIQKRFFSVTKRKKRIKVCKEYLLIDINEYINKDNVDINWVNVGGNATKESKVKESKVNESKVIFSFPLSGKEKQEYPIYEKDINEWQESFPGIDVIQQLRNCRQWSIDNPTKKKTKRGIRRHINYWLSREQDKGGKPSNGDGRVRATTVHQEGILQRNALAQQILQERENGNNERASVNDNGLIEHKVS